MQACRIASERFYKLRYRCNGSKQNSNNKQVSFELTSQCRRSSEESRRGARRLSYAAFARSACHARQLLSEVAAPIRLFRPSGRTRWGGSRLITDRAAFWCATPHRMVNETEELDRWSPQSHRPSLADQNLSYNSQPSGLALLTKASMFQPLLPFDCWATVLSGRPRNRLAGRLSPACPIAPDPDP